MRIAPVLLATWIAVGASAQDLDDVEIDTVDLGGGLAMLVGRGGNVGLSVGPDGSVLIDDELAPLGPRIRAAVEAFGGGPVRFVVNTHHHADHVGGNAAFARQGAVVVAHENVRARLSAPQHDALLGATVPPAPPAARPVVTYADGVAFHLNGHVIRAFHVPRAHTDGDSIVFVEDANVLHMGDAYSAGMYPYIDVEAGGSIDGLIAAAERGLSLADDATRIIPGHGPLSNRRELAAYRDMLVAVRDGVQEQIAAGRDEAETIAARPTRRLDPVWATGFMKPEYMVRVVYRSLRGRPGGD